MKFSVLIAAYQADAFILTALKCLRDQTHHNWEVIVVEDGSHDRTEAIVKEFAVSVAQPVRYHNLGKNCGVGTARNTLLSLASGDAVAFLDADDTWEPSHLENAKSKIERGADLVVSGVQTFDLVKNIPLEVVHAPIALVRDPLLTLFQRSAIITSSAVVLTRELVQRTGEFDVSLRIGEDRDYWLRCALVGGRFQVSKAVTCNYAKHDGSSMARTYLVAQQITRFYEKHRALKAVPARLRRHLLADSLIALGRLLRSHDAPRSVACFWRAWQCEPLNPRIACHLMFTGWRSIAPQRVAQ
jgi:glycosyltransferase involved in cell wall biosynthesis